MKKAIFYNHHHNGDLHLSRGLVVATIKALREINPEIDVVYSHRNNPDVLSDLEIKHDSTIVNGIVARSPSQIIGDEIYINTWYGADNLKYLNKYGVSFDCLYYLFKNVFKLFDKEISSDIINLFPSIDYAKYKIDEIKKWQDKYKNNKKVLVANGLAGSGQAVNFLMTPLVLKIAKAHKDTIFILTNKEPKCNFTTNNNVYYSPDIIKKTSGSDLNENAFLATHCDLVIGRGSGVFSFCYNQDMLFNKNVTMLSFTRPPKEYASYISPDWLNSDFRNKVSYKANIVSCNDTSSRVIARVIESYL